jgi:rsbT antagonist protein RsbS
MPIPIQRQGNVLIASLQSELADGELRKLRGDLDSNVNRFRIRGLVLDVTALEVLDSFGSRTILDIAHTAKLRGADTVVVGIQPEVAVAMVQLGLTFERVHTALDLEDGLALLEQLFLARAQGARA